MAEVVVDIDQLITEFGAYYKKGSQGVKDIRKKILVMNETDELFVRQITTDTVLEGGTAEIDPVLQAYQDAFTPKGDVTFGARRIPLYPMKIDWEKNPTKIWNSWLGFLASDNLDRKEWPFIRYIIEQLILPKATEDWEISAIYNGVIQAIVAGTPMLSGGAINGIKTLLNAHITAGDTTPIAVGAVPTDAVEFVDYVENFVEQIPDHVMPYLQQIAMSKKLYKLYRKGKRLKYNMNYQQAELDTVEDTELVVKGYRSHQGSTKIWTTIKGNAVMGLKHSGNENTFEIEKSKRTVSLYTDFWKGIGFWQPEYIYTNDVELV